MGKPTCTLLVIARTVISSTSRARAGRGRSSHNCSRFNAVSEKRVDNEIMRPQTQAVGSMPIG